MDKIEIGKIVKEQGIKGDVKIILFADDDFDLGTIKSVYVNDKIANVEKVYKLNGGYGVKLDIIDSRNTASLYKNASIYVDRVNIKCKEDRYFIVDLLDKDAVLENGTIIGKITDIQNFGSADVIYIKQKDKQVLLSHINGLIETVDGKKVVLNEAKFNQVVVYED